MRKWLHDNPWIWVVVFLAVLVAGSLTMLVIAQLNRPEIVKDKATVMSYWQESAPPASPRPHALPRA